MLSSPIAREGFEPIRGWCAQVTEAARVMQYVELSQCLFLDPAEAFRETVRPQAPGDLGSVSVTPISRSGAAHRRVIRERDIIQPLQG